MGAGAESKGGAFATVGRENERDTDATESRPASERFYFPNLQLRLVPPTEEARARGVEVATFITTPNVTKTEVKAFLT